MTEREIMRAEVKQAVREAMQEALSNSSLVDGPTHIRHHQAIDEMLSMMVHAKKTAVGWIVRGLLLLMVLGAAAWVVNHKN